MDLQQKMTFYHPSKRLSFASPEPSPQMIRRTTHHGNIFNDIDIDSMDVSSEVNQEFIELQRMHAKERAAHNLQFDNNTDSTKNTDNTDKDKTMGFPCDNGCCSCGA